MRLLRFFGGRVRVARYDLIRLLRSWSSYPSGGSGLGTRIAVEQEMCIACAWPSWASVVLVASSTASLAPRAPTCNAVSFRDCPRPPRQLVLHPLILICRDRAPDRLLGAGQYSRQSTRRRAERTPTRSTSSRCSPRRSRPRPSLRGDHVRAEPPRHTCALAQMACCRHAATSCPHRPCLLIGWHPATGYRATSTARPSAPSSSRREPQPRPHTTVCTRERGGSAPRSRAPT
jgi:hypothetical protein